MTDARKTKAELIAECQALRDRVAEFEDRLPLTAEDVFGNSPVGVFVLDDKFRVAWVNEALERFFDLNKNDVLGKDKRQLILERIRFLFEDHETFSRKVLATYDDNTYVEQFECHVLPDGDRAERWLEHCSQPIVSGPFAGGRTESYYDITERKRSEQAFRQIEARYHAIAEKTYDIIAEFDAKGRFVYISPNSERSLGYATSELLGRPFDDVLHPEELEALTAGFGRALGSRSRESRTVRLRNKDGSWRWVEGTAFSFETPTGETRLLGIGRDVTERKRMEERLSRSQRLASIGTLAAGIAHEINNPLGGTLLAAQYALEFRDDSSAVTNALKAIVRQTKRCGEVVKSVLTFAQEGRTEKHLTELNSSVHHARDLIRSYAEERGSTIELDLSDALPLVVMNQTEMGLAIVNLIRNAVQAGAKRIQIRTLCTPEAVNLSIRDDGSGISREALQHIFEPFYTTRERQGGTGLGLSIAHGIITSHGGSIDIESQVEQGTMITLSLPRTGEGDG